ncbi:hypothetical protein VNO78_16382 [Psophocarpus tetragonolobus]|uniref:Uncharacterized protein n=1 Tax=Psophocarpus tetragonolobus TaxID=3891 RepID=A0AAN9SGR2_PSOTE
MGSQSRTRQLSMDCPSYSCSEIESSRVGRGTSLGTSSSRSLPWALNSQLKASAAPLFGPKADLVVRSFGPSRGTCFWQPLRDGLASLDTLKHNSIGRQVESFVEDLNTWQGSGQVKWWSKQNCAMTKFQFVMDGKAGSAWSMAKSQVHGQILMVQGKVTMHNQVPSNDARQGKVRIRGQDIVVEGKVGIRGQQMVMGARRKKLGYMAKKGAKLGWWKEKWDMWQRKRQERVLKGKSREMWCQYRVLKAKSRETWPIQCQHRAMEGKSQETLPIQCQDKVLEGKVEKRGQYSVERTCWKEKVGKCGQDNANKGCWKEKGVGWKKSGNVVKTVPREGVGRKKSGNVAKTASTQDARRKNSRYVAKIVPTQGAGRKKWDTWPRQCQHKMLMVGGGAHYSMVVLNMESWPLLSQVSWM